MFDHPHHQKIHLILDSLDASIFNEVGAYFSGGTLITLLHNEYRWSKNVDFICPVGPGYRRLRELVGQNFNNPTTFFQKTDLLEIPRHMSADQYGVKFLVMADGEPIIFEIVAENRIQLEKYDEFEWTERPCLSVIDRFAEKLLANADRWNDESIQSRDLIDLAVMRRERKVSEQAIEKSEAAYPVIDPLTNALLKFRNSRKYRKKMFRCPSN
jgi:hypothetical protein